MPEIMIVAIDTGAAGIQNHHYPSEAKIHTGPWQGWIRIMVDDNLRGFYPLDRIVCITGAQEPVK